MPRPPVKVAVNNALVRLTGYHLTHGKPGSIPPAAQQEIETLRARLQNQRARAKRAEADARGLQRQLDEWRDGKKRRDSLRQVWPLAPRAQQPVAEPAPVPES